VGSGAHSPPSKMAMTVRWGVQPFTPLMTYAEMICFCASR
jgi:hypothetical protein